MSHLDEIKGRVDAAIHAGVIASMNELLIALSNDDALGREERYVEQQRLRAAIAHHGRQHKEDLMRQSEARREKLNRGGTIL
ncbi:MULTISPECIES: DUF2526 family protein [Tenebrionibacter/Tenebrionicola group]|jgi:succinylglutamate desuccinylase|uniref:DUF2526 family protein n=2 Tax=Tenebrionibacter/Tenebrionicola group TaxID=2969848 RepID=A0A8K0V532_9ENTR|nr:MULTISPECIES: DUF2526 family protein [Tenebrionibacter/Tenebrionicola group]MBK4715558.1 DUF2526 family protein [Tenebrionibacter intestinalis]MBV4411360.1 DUF2526 family protein [Tenebrionicola larvae]MBV5095801.1 DUF2526 family protein [Tenebrionicola larvae]